MNIKLIVGLTASLSLLGCEQKVEKKPIELEPEKPLYQSTYQPLPSEEFVIVNATILDGSGKQFDNATLWVKAGKIQAVGNDVKIPSGIKSYDGKGKWVTPGLIDVHSHLGVYPSPSHEANADGNEMTGPNTAGVWAEHAVWTQDPGFDLALAGGVTSLQVLPGSANLFGGRTVTLKNVPSITMQGMKFPGAPHGLKMACGENPKRVYGSKRQKPMTRMGNVLGYRNAWIKAAEYKKKWDDYYQAAKEGEEKDKPKKDLQLETLAEVLNGNILIHNHCYRAEEMAIMIDIANEFDYQISTFHHAVESYKIADLLAEKDICSAMWADWWGFKHEAYDSVRENIAMVDKANACAIVHSDSAIGIQHLNQESAKAMAAGNKRGLKLTAKDAIRWTTSNAAKSLGIEDKVGTLQSNMMADVVLWSQNPFSVYAKAEKVFIDGALVFDRDNKSANAVSDFDLGVTDPAGERL
ncbi:amidohydrolase [Aliikangiella marina]|uniref:Amidohydrolase n=1 Tax=Aliikangiella marina TaxID=1712262 RepID=A0A545TDF0_9GAMM|nr:amidohydrolase [Aliikangiella marina]TQV75248.1 amidohydrolase [Aliikangiella marina]